MQEKSSEEKWGCPEKGTRKIWSIIKPKTLKEFSGVGVENLLKLEKGALACCSLRTSVPLLPGEEFSAKMIMKYDYCEHSNNHFPLFPAESRQWKDDM